VPAPSRDTESRSRDVCPYQGTLYLYFINEMEELSFSSFRVAALGLTGRVTYSRRCISTVA
jgi:hypothetical protein